jgi:oligopeptide/dipeptide ABC transporter ATP-binding protein
MRQRVMIAQALACNPDLLIADEPTTALDVTVQARILELIAELKERHRTSVLYISHDLSLVRRICDRVAVMYAGRVAEEAAAATLYASPQHPYTQQLLASFPDVAHPDRPLRGIPGAPPRLDAMPSGCRFTPRCPYAFERCPTERPPEYPAPGGGRAACFLLDPAEAARRG